MYSHSSDYRIQHAAKCSSLNLCNLEGSCENRLSLGYAVEITVPSFGIGFGCDCQRGWRFVDTC